VSLNRGKTFLGGVIVAVSVFLEVTLFRDGLVSVKVAHDQRDLHLQARYAVLDRAFDVLVRGGELTDNPVVEVRVIRNGKLTVVKQYVFNHGEIARALKKEVEEAWATGEWDDYLNTSVEEAWGEALEESPDLRMVFETLAL